MYSVSVSTCVLKCLVMKNDIWRPCEELNVYVCVCVCVFSPFLCVSFVVFQCLSSANDSLDYES